jgi:hypothetical protein
MSQKSETPRAGGVSRNSFGGQFRANPSPLDVQTQLLISRHSVRPTIATTVATLAFGRRENG